MRQVGLIFDKNGVGKKIDKTVKKTVKVTQPTKTNKATNGEKPAQ